MFFLGDWGLGGSPTAAWTFLPAPARKEHSSNVRSAEAWHRSGAQSDRTFPQKERHARSGKWAGVLCFVQSSLGRLAGRWLLGRLLLPSHYTLQGGHSGSTPQSSYRGAGHESNSLILGIDRGPTSAFRSFRSYRNGHWKASQEFSRQSCGVLVLHYTSFPHDRSLKCSLPKFFFG